MPLFHQKTAFGVVNFFQIHRGDRRDSDEIKDNLWLSYLCHRYRKWSIYGLAIYGLAIYATGIVNNKRILLLSSLCRAVQPYVIDEYLT